jgi:hypothetical protein
MVQCVDTVDERGMSRVPIEDNPVVLVGLKRMKGKMKRKHNQQHTKLQTSVLKMVVGVKRKLFVNCGYMICKYSR